MSWSVQLVGTAGKLAEMVKQAFEKAGGAYDGVETETKNAVGAMVQAMCVSLPADLVVSVNASGSMWKDQGVIKQHNLKVEVQPLYGWVG